MIANKMTGKKGVIFTATYEDERFHRKGNAVRWHSIKRAGGITGGGSKHAEDE